MVNAIDIIVRVPDDQFTIPINIQVEYLHSNIYDYKINIKDFAKQIPSENLC